MSDALGIVRTPARPGPGPTPEALLRALDVVVRRRVEALLTGDHRSTAIGIGTELAQIRPYQPGDDVRRIDWNVTARTQEPHVRDQVAERALVSWLVLDTSPSMSFGTADRRKADVAEGVALAVGHVGTHHGNRLGVITFGDAKPLAIPPRQGRVGLIGLLTIARREPQVDGGGATSLGEALARSGWTPAAAGCASGSRPPPRPSGTSWSPSCGRPAPTTSCCGPPATGFAPSPASCVTAPSGRAAP